MFIMEKLERTGPVAPSTHGLWPLASKSRLPLERKILRIHPPSQSSFGCLGIAL